MEQEQTNGAAASPMREIRLKLEFTQQQLADELGIHKDSERRHEYDGTLPKSRAVQKNLQRLAKKAGVSLEATR